MTDKSIKNSIPKSKKFIYSTKELAELLNCTVITANRIRNSGQIPYFQAGKRKYIFDVEKVMKAIKRGPK